jgi:hypothetical protein
LKTGLSRPIDAIRSLRLLARASRPWFIIHGVLPALRSLIQPPNRLTSVDWCLLVGCVLAAAGGVIVLVAPAGGVNRVSGAALPFALSAIAQLANVLTRRRSRWLSGLLYALAVLAILYAVILAVSVPLRLTVEGRCEPAPAPCPLGFDLPISAGENVAVYAAVVCGALSMLVVFLAAELQFRPRGRRFAPPDDPQKPL